jgi:hypothetical protein
VKPREEGSSVKNFCLMFIGRVFCLPGYVIIILQHSYFFALVCNDTTLPYFKIK